MARASLSPRDKALVKLAGLPGEAPASEVGATKAVAAELEAAGLVTLRTEARKLLVTPTEAGRARGAELSAAAPAPAPARAPSGVEGRLDALEARLARMEGTLERIAAAVAPVAAAGDLEARVLATIAELDQTRRYGGLVPLTDLRAALPGVPAAELDALLLELEGRYVLDLNVAQSPTLVARRQDGIERPGRGLLYYVGRRAS